ncbi:MAG: DUF4369 domain-containing protein, partial [Flavobacteriaceae bacterium]|nr:DUF4369 domain-containing protein [Flavobacteriaceae bacterium]
EVYLKKIDENNRPVVIDTTMILQNSFSFSGETPALDMYLVTINGVGQVPVILEDGVIEINTLKDSVQFAKVEGTEQNQIFTNFRLGNVKIGKRMQAINQEFMEATRSQDSVNMQALRDEYAELQEENKNYMVNFVKDNPKGLVSGMVLNNLLQTRALKASEVSEIYATLAPTVKDHGSVKKIMETINAMKVTEEG